MASRFTFTEEHKEAIKQAVANLETESAGEIVPYFARRSDDYEEARWKSAVILTLFGILVLAFMSYSWSLPFAITPLEISIYLFLLLLIGFFLPIIFPAYIRFLINQENLLTRVENRAIEMFLAEEVFKTKDRIGVLIYVSELEHQVVVLGDSGINAKVKNEDWKHVVDIIIEGIKSKKVADGLVRAISECKQLLLDNGFVAGADDKNELSDDLRLD